jgi:cytochrome c553
MKPLIKFLGMSLGLLLMVTQAYSQSLQVQQWASSCTSCHGSDGYSRGGIPSIAGLNKNTIIESMGDYKSGKRTGTIMHQISKGYSDVQIEKIADYFASLPTQAPPSPK